MTKPDRRFLSRRSLLLGLGAPLLATVAGGGSSPALAARPERLRPQAGDRLTLMEGERRGAPLAPTDVELGAPPLTALPLELSSGLVRDGSRLNQVLLIRLDPAALDPDTRALAADGVVAYSAVCTHTGCPVSEWNATEARLVCPCHGSEFEVAARARVALGPAPRRLAALPLAIEARQLVVAGPFRGRVGFQMA